LPTVVKNIGEMRSYLQQQEQASQMEYKDLACIASPKRNVLTPDILESHAIVPFSAISMHFLRRMLLFEVLGFSTCAFLERSCTFRGNFHGPERE